MTLDLNTLRSAATLFGFIVFVLLVWRIWRREAQPAHDRAAALPFMQDGTQGEPRE